MITRKLQKYEIGLCEKEELKVLSDCPHTIWEKEKCRAVVYRWKMNNIKRKNKNRHVVRTLYTPKNKRGIENIKIYNH